jgi:16S rRNA (cytosine1402-N4)-methyltransferase
MLDAPSESIHTSVMLPEVLEYLNLSEGGCVVDFTLGIGGHALEMLKRIGAEGRLIGIDRDGESLELARQRLKDYQSQCTLFQSDYRNMDEVLSHAGVREVDAMLFDLGISSYQLNNAQRGFSLRLEGPLDMRMDTRSYISAYDLINSLSEKELATILKNFGQERWHHRIAHYVVNRRGRAPIESTKDLRELVQKAVPNRYQREKIHPATRTFQAIRIAVNRELEALSVAMDKCLEYLKKGGRVCVISFHSLEDKIVKERFRALAKEGRVQLLTKKPLRPTPEEVHQNPRSRSARLRAAERIQ